MHHPPRESSDRVTALDGHFIIDSVRYDRIILRREAEDLYAAVDCGGHEILEEWRKLHGGGAS